MVYLSMPKIRFQPIFHTDHDQAFLLRLHQNLQPKNVKGEGVG